MSRSIKEFVLRSDAYMRDARPLSSAVASSVHATKTLADQTADIGKARHQMEIRCVAHVMRKVHSMADQKFTSLAEVGCRFHEKLVEIVGKERVPSLPKVWSKAKPQRERRNSQRRQWAAHRSGAFKKCQRGRLRKRCRIASAERGPQ